MQYPESSEHHHRVSSGQAYLRITHASRVIVQQHFVPLKARQAPGNRRKRAQNTHRKNRLR